MRKIFSILTLLIFKTLFSQVDADSTLGLPGATTANILLVAGANEGSLLYSTDENIIYQFDGTNWIPVANDNLGNHIATQNIRLNNNFISGDGDNEGIFITDANGNVGISNIGFTPQRQFHVAGTNGGIRLDRYGNDAFFFFVNLDGTGANVIQNWAFINDDADNSFQIRNYGTAVAGVGLANSLVIKQTNQLQLPAYGTPTTFDDNTATKILGVQPDGDVVQLDKSSLGGSTGAVYEKIVIWAEEGGGLNDNSLEWSFGNSATGQIGIPLPENWEAYAVSLNSDVNGATDSAEIAVIDSRTNTNLFTFTANAGGVVDNMVYTEILTTPIAIPAGTSIGFRTVNEIGTISDVRVAVFLRRLP